MNDYPKGDILPFYFAFNFNMVRLEGKSLGIVYIFLSFTDC